MKFKSFLTAHKALVKDIAISAGLLGASAGIVFGISAGMFKVQYVDLNNGEARKWASDHNGYYSENIKSGWNMNQVVDPVSGQTTMQGLDFDTLISGTPLPQQMTDLATWQAWHPGSQAAPFDKKDNLQLEEEEGGHITDAAAKARYDFATMVIDGATHTTMDRSFNQQLYEGIVDFNKNAKCTSYSPENMDPTKNNSAMSLKPSQDNTTEFINTYMSIINQSGNGMVGLAGFNHATPLNAMMIHNMGSDGILEPYATASSQSAQSAIQKTGFVLLDSNCPNNQNVASVQFRSDQPGFLTAIATCQYLFNNLHLYHNSYQDLAVAEFGGVPIPTVMIYMGGFQRGIEFYNNFVLADTIAVGKQFYFNGTEPTGNLRDEQCFASFNNMVEHSRYHKEIEQIKDSQLSTQEKIAKFDQDVTPKFINEYSVKMIKLGDAGTHFSGTFSSGDAIGITKQYLNRGASAIVAVAGPQSLDAAQEIQNQNSKCIVIGVDSAMENGDYQRYHNGCSAKNKEVHNTKDPFMDKTVAEDESTPTEANSIIKFSAIKDIKTVSNKMTRLIAGGYNWDITKEDENGVARPDPERAICGPGFQTCCNIKNGLISISYDGFYPFIQAMSHIQLSYDGADDENIDTVWKEAAKEYANALTDDELAVAGEEYFPQSGPSFDLENGVFNIHNLFSYKTSDDSGTPTTYYKNYNHTMGILGLLLEKSTKLFSKDMTLVPGDGGYVIPDTDQNISILSWLDYNMYLNF